MTVVGRRLGKVHILVELGQLLGPKRLLEMIMKQLDQVPDRQARIAPDGAGHQGMIERDAEAGVRKCVFDDQIVLLFAGDGVFDAVGGNTGGARVSRDVVMEFGGTQVGGGRDEGVDRRRSDQ